MSTQTQHIGLHQWESTDPFLREDFNQDHRLIDAAVGRIEGKADRALSGLEGMSYNVYNLLLQNYCEGKYTGFKRGLMFDGFLDESCVSSWEGSAYRDAASSTVSIDTEGQPSIPRPETGAALMSAGPKQSVVQEWTAQGNGVITAVSVYGECPSYGLAHKVTFSIWRNGEKLADSGKENLFTQDGKKWYEFPVNCPVHKGCTYEFRFYNTGSGGSFGDILCCRGAGGAESPLALGITATPGGGSSGALVTLPAQIGQWRRAVCYIRCNGDGQLAAQLGSGSGSWESMASGGSASSGTVDGSPCMECAFTLESAEVRDAAALRLTLTARDGMAPVVYDYGVIFTE